MRTRLLTAALLSLLMLAGLACQRQRRLEQVVQQPIQALPRGASMVGSLHLPSLDEEASLSLPHPFVKQYVDSVEEISSLDVFKDTESLAFALYNRTGQGMPAAVFVAKGRLAEAQLIGSLKSKGSYHAERLRYKGLTYYQLSKGKENFYLGFPTQGLLFGAVSEDESLMKNALALAIARGETALTDPLFEELKSDVDQTAQLWVMGKDLDQLLPQDKGKSPEIKAFGFYLKHLQQLELQLVLLSPTPTQAYQLRDSLATLLHTTEELLSRSPETAPLQEMISGLESSVNGKKVLVKGRYHPEKVKSWRLRADTLEHLLQDFKIPAKEE